MPRDEWRRANLKSRYGYLDGPSEKKRKRKKKKRHVYSFPIGTDCFVRKRGQKKWRDHRLRKPVRNRPYLWRNSDWVGILIDGWEVKFPLDQRKRKA